MKKMQIVVLLAVWQPENEDQSFGCTLPGILGANSAGESFEECKENIKEVALFHTEEAPLTQEDLHKAYDTAVILSGDENYAGCWWHHMLVEAWVEDTVEPDFDYLQFRDQFRDIDAELKEAMAEVKGRNNEQ